MRRGLTVLLSVAILGLCPGPGAVAWAQSDADRIARVEELALKGAKAFKAERYEEAIEAFEEAYALEPVPNLLYNIAKSYEKLNRWDEAISHYKRFAVADDVNSKAREDALESIERLKQLRALEDSDEDGVADVDDLCPGEKEDPDGYKDIDGCPEDNPTAAGGGEGVEGGEGPEGTVEVLPPDYTWAWTAGGAGLALVAGGAVLGVLAQGTHDDFEAAETAEERRTLRDSGQSLALYADIAYVAGAVGLLTGVILWATASETEVVREPVPQAGRWFIEPWLTPTRAGVGMRLEY